MPRITSTRSVLRHALTLFRRKFQQRLVLFPTSDLAVLYLTSLLPDYPPYVATLPPSDLVSIFVHKHRFYHSLHQHGIPYPRTFDLNETTMDTIPRDVSYPVFLKPSMSQRFFHAYQRKGFVAANPTEARAYLQQAQTHGFHLLLQEIIPGPPRHLVVVTGYIDPRGQPQVVFATHNLRQPNPFLDNSCSVSFPLAAARDVVTQTLRYLAVMRYRGLFIAEWKRDARDETMKLLEINPRCGGYNSHPIACGVNPILAAYHDALQNPVPVTRTYKTGIYCIHWLADLRSCLRALWYRQTTLREIIQTYRGPTHWLVYAHDDILPCLHQWHP